MRRSRLALVALAAGLALAARPAPASAQGNGHGNAFGHNNKAPAATGPSAAGAPEIDVSGTGVRNFGSWLDDASVIPPGSGYASLAFGYWRMPGYREFDMPVMDSGFGLLPRVQVGVSVPFYHASQPGGPVARGMGDLSLSTKIQLRAPTATRAGFSVTPMVEVLSTSPGPDRSRVSWALPGNIEVQRKAWRVYGSAGYFSRGALFASGALEAGLADRVWLTGSLSHSYSVRRDDLSAALGLSKVHTDLTAGASVLAGPNLMVFTSVGRTISKRDANSATLMITGGLSVSFSAW